MDYNQAPPTAPTTSPQHQGTVQQTYPQAQPQQGYYQAQQPQYQGSAVMQPQYQPMGQVVQFPTQAPTDSTPTQSPTQVLAETIRMLATQQNGQTPYQSPVAPSQQSAQAYLNTIPQTQFPQASPPISSPTPTSSPNSTPNFSQHSLELLSQLSSPNAIASAQIPDDQIPASKGSLNAYAVEVEDQLMQLGQRYQQVAQIAQEGQALMNLIQDPNNFGTLTQVYVEQMLRYSNGVDVLDAVLSRVSGQPTMRQQAQQPVQQPPANVPPSTYGWGDGFSPESRDVESWGNNVQRPNFPAPLPGSAPQGDISQVRPDQAWMMIDAMARNGGFRNKVLVQDN